MKFDPKSRYYDQGGIEVQEIIRAKLTPEQYRGFCLGNIIKYSCRANFKGDFDRDMEKVGFYQTFLNAEQNTQSIKNEHCDPLQNPAIEEMRGYMHVETSLINLVGCRDAEEIGVVTVCGTGKVIG